MLGVWIAGAIVVFGLYFHNFTNTVNPAYAYGQGGENTLAHSAVHAITHPGVHGVVESRDHVGIGLAHRPASGPVYTPRP
jgi:hypothetical protein